ncbi:MAG: hypothetical protein KTR27_21280 [Leptolyngbyaceae cyanobacterium MAG.088]|nr:hypothetical protein [Leptolyngbyaceae cyanobacterium MAG.088]
MSNSIDSDFVALHSQHTLQHADWMTISELAKAENISGCFYAWDFEDFLGLAVHLFVTTQSQDVRQQLSQLLPKFGSAVVVPLLKILCKKEVFAEINIPALAQKNLNEMELYPLVIGLNQILSLNFQDDLKALALQTLRQLLQSCEQSTNLVLSQLLSEANRQLVAEVSDFRLSGHVSSGASRIHHAHDSTTAVLERKAMQCL